MALAERAKLIAELSLDDKMSPAIQRIDRRLGAFSGAVNRNLGRAVDTAASFAARKLVGGFQAGVESLRELESVTAQTNAVLKSTKGSANLSAQAILDLSEKYEGLNATIDNKVIQSAENVLLTFTNVRRKAFEPALEAALNLNQAMGGGEGGLQGTIVQLGKALNDPVKGITALQRVGVSFTTEQKKRIAALVKENKLYAAQQIILKELGKEFGGSFAAGGKTAEGQQAALQDAIEGVNVALAKHLLPVVTTVSKRLTEFLGKESTIKFFEDLSKTISGLFTDENLDLAANSIQTAASAVSAAISAFNKLPGPIKALAIGAFAINKVTGGAVTGAVGAVGKLLGAGLSKIFATNVTVVGANVRSGGSLPGTGTTTAGSKVGSVASKGLSTLGKVFLIGETIGLVTSVIAVQQEIAAGNSQLATGLQETLNRDINRKSPEELRTALRGVQDGINRLQANPLNVLVQGSALDTLKAMESSLQKQLASDPKAKTGLPGIGQQLADGLKKAIPAFKIPELQKTLNSNLTKLQGLQDKLHRAKESGDKQRIGELKGRMGEVKQRIDASRTSIVQAQQATKVAATAAGVRTANATNSAATRIVAGFHSIAPPIVNVNVTSNSITKSITYSNRAGPVTGSQGGKNVATKP